MPKIIIPHLPPDIEQFGVCVVFDKEIEELMAWSRTQERDHAFCQYNEGDQDRWLSLSLSACDDEEHVHFHIEIARIDLRQDDQRPLSRIDELTGIIDEFIDRAAGIEAVVQPRGRFRVPRKQIPEHGVIGSLLSFKKKASGAPFSLKNARLDVDHEWFTQMDFLYDEEDEEVRTQLWAIAAMELDHEFLAETAEVMATGGDCFIFERVSKEAST